MLWTIAVVLVILWLLGLVSGCEWLYDGFVYPHSLRSCGFSACGQSQSGGYDQPEAETFIAKSQPKTR